MRRRFAIAAACVLLSIGVAAAPAAASTSWIPVSSTHVSGQYERPQAIVAPGAQDVWAIGYHLDYVAGTPEFRTLAQHWTGTDFATVPTPDRETGPARDFLNGAAAPASDDVWAVGTTIGIGQPSQTLVEHWNGEVWSLVASPNPGANGNYLQAAAATSSGDVWAVGARINAGHFYQRPLVIHWNGARWTTLPAPSAPGCTGHSYLTAVTALSATQAWATGWCGSGGSTAERGFVLQWDGTSRTLMTVIPQRIAPESETYGIAATGPRNIWVVGYYRPAASSTSAALTYHFDGQAWSLVDGPSTSDALAGITLGGSGLWVVGEGSSPQPPFVGPAAASRHGTGWTNRPT